MKADIYIGIDPDTELSGVARLDMMEKKTWADTLPFPLLLQYILSVKRDARLRGHRVVVVIEASWKTTTNWHTHRGDTLRTSAKKGYDVGRCHETGKKIVEMMDYYGIEVIEQKPLKKVWKGPDGKISHAEMKEVCGWNKKRSNQEERDAMLLAWYASGLPIRVKA